MSQLTVKIDTTDETMVGGEGWGEYDPIDSTLEFLSNVQSALAPLFSNDLVLVERGEHRSMYDRDGEPIDDGSEYDLIFDTIHQVWSSWEWLRK